MATSKNKSTKVLSTVPTILGRLLGFELPTRSINDAALAAVWTEIGAENADFAAAFGKSRPEAPGNSKRAFLRAMASMTMRGQNPDERIVSGQRRLPLDPMTDAEGKLLTDPTTGRVRGYVVVVDELSAAGKAKAGLSETLPAFALHRGAREADAMLAQGIVSWNGSAPVFSTSYLESEIRASYADFAANPTDQDLRPVIVEMIARTLPLYVKGRTVQFVGAEHDATINAVVSILRASGADDFFVAAVNSGDPITQETLAAAFMRETERKMTEIGAKISADLGTDGVREKTFAGYGEALKDLRAWGLYHGTLLQIASDDMGARIAEMEKLVLDAARGVVAGKAAKKTATAPATGAKGAKSAPLTRVCPHEGCARKLTGVMVKAPYCGHCGKPLPAFVAPVAEVAPVETSPVSVADDSAAPLEVETAPEASPDGSQTHTLDASDPFAG